MGTPFAWPSDKEEQAADETKTVFPLRVPVDHCAPGVSVVSAGSRPPNVTAVAAHGATQAPSDTRGCVEVRSYSRRQRSAVVCASGMGEGNRPGQGSRK